MSTTRPKNDESKTKPSEKGMFSGEYKRLPDNAPPIVLTTPGNLSAATPPPTQQFMGNTVEANAVIGCCECCGKVACEACEFVMKGFGS